MDTATGAVTTLAGSGASGYADSTNGTLAMFFIPQGIALDPGTGILYVGEWFNHVIRTVNASSGETGTLAGTPPPVGTGCVVAGTP